jgi:hypothetical protein
MFRASRNLHSVVEVCRCAALTIVVVAPSPDASVCAERDGVVIATSDLYDISEICWSVALTLAIVAPAANGAASAERDGMRVSTRDLYDIHEIRWHVALAFVVSSPAPNNAALCESIGCENCTNKWAGDGYCQSLAGSDLPVQILLNLVYGRCEMCEICC